ncbi:hypothetical protein [Marinicrinis sediminis]|uniref:Uncharacterized protein n=1 Tax=Marinicrinis sediminis TaxID=1652465 RepID=A0ABW5RF13_9BACL
MIRRSVITRKIRIGRNKYVLVTVKQIATAIAPNGNANATNQAAITVKPMRKKRRNRKWRWRRKLSS